MEDRFDALSVISTVVLDFSPLLLAAVSGTAVVPQVSDIQSSPPGSPVALLPGLRALPSKVKGSVQTSAPPVFINSLSRPQGCLVVLGKCLLSPSFIN